VREAADRLYAELLAAGIDTLLDDRAERPGVLFADMDLLGIPLRVVLGERGLRSGMAELKARLDPEPRDVPLEGLVAQLKERIVGA
jgi:prolyl-tRNA synthetase